MKYNVDGYWITVVGYGISQGAGNYFLFKLSDSDNVSDKYYCFEAEAGEAELQALEDAGSETVPENCTDYADGVDALTPFTTTDLATEAADFNTGTAGEGTIYFNE